MHIEFLLIADTFQNMFSLDAEQVTWAEKILRPVIVYVALIVLLRVVGKRELAQLNPLDLVVILSLSNTVQNAIIGNDTSLVGGLVGAAALLAINAAVAYFKYRSKGIEAAIEGSPVTIIDKGKIDERHMRAELMTESDLDIIAHENGMEDRHEIERLVLDPNGSFLVDGKDEIKDAKFKREVLKKIDELTKQLGDLNAALKNAR